MNHDEITGDKWKDKKYEWADYSRNDVLCTVFSYASYTEAMEEITGFGMKDCLSSSGLRWKRFNSLRTEADESINTYNDKNNRWFVRQSIKEGRVCAFNQYYKSKICDDILKIVSEELNVKRKIYDITEAYLNYKKKLFQIFEKEYENQFNDYRDEDEEEKETYINEKLSQLPIHQLKKQKKVDELFLDFDAVILYPSAMWDENSIYPRIETGYAFTRNMNKKLVEKFNNQNLNEEVLF